MDHVLTCILNDEAGCNNAAEARALIRRGASERGWKARVLLSSTGSDLPRLAEQARATGGLIVSGGGDGTIAAVAAALVGKDAVFGVLPMGPTISPRTWVSRLSSRRRCKQYSPAKSPASTSAK
jgi:diacylglycerol kinase family enzyme